MVSKTGIGDRTFDMINYTALIFYAIVAIFPFIYVILASFTPPEEFYRYQFMFFPKKFTLENYEYIFTTNTVLRGLLVSVFVTVTGTLLSIFMTALTAYPLSHKYLIGKKQVMAMIIFTLLFEGGMIPTYMVVQKLGMLNSYSSIFLPALISPFNLIIFINFFKQLPDEIEDSAKIDGCHDLKILFSIILPVSMPLIATFIVIYGVWYWNSWFNFVLYINDSGKWPVQVILRQILSASDSSIGDAAVMHDQLYLPPKETIRMCIITIVTVPILCIYPFFQKYFVKGMLLGSVKG